MKKMGIKAIITLFCAVLLATLCAGTHQARAGVIKLGVLLPLTGRYADFGEQMKRGIELAIEHQAKDPIMIKNELYKVQIVWADSEGKLEVALPAVQKMITVDKINAATGFFYSSIFLGVMNEFQRHRIPTVDTVGAATAIFKEISKKKMEYIFQLSPTVDDMGKSSAAATHHYLKPQKIALLSEDSDAGREINRYCVEWFKKNARDVKIVFDEYVDAETVDFSSELVKIKASGAEVQFSLILGASSGPMIQQREELKVNAWLSHFGGTVDAPDFRKKYGTLMEGMLINVRFWPGEYTPLSAKVYQDYEKRYGVKPTTFSVQAYEGALVLLESIRRTKSLDPDAIKNHLESGKFLGVRGEVTFTSLEDGHRSPAQMAVCQVRAGELIPIWPLAIAKPGAFNPNPKK